jgi:tyrosyl-tRNA synthetase
VAVQADIELGGTDQKFNLLMGREIQQEYKQEPQVVMMMPLLEGLDGVRKMSKSYGNYVAFNDPPQEMFGKLMSVPDALMPKYVELLTDLDLSALKKMHPKDAKVLLAKTITAQFHGEAAAAKEAQDFDLKFSKKEFPQDAEEKKIRNSDKPWSVVDLIVDMYSFSKKEAQRLVAQGAVEIDGQSCDLKSTIVLRPGEQHTIKIGKRRFAKVSSVASPNFGRGRPQGTGEGPPSV